MQRERSFVCTEIDHIISLRKKISTSLEILEVSSFKAVMFEVKISDLMHRLLAAKGEIKLFTSLNRNKNVFKFAFEDIIDDLQSECLNGFVYEYVDDRVVIMFDYIEAGGTLNDDKHDQVLEVFTKLTTEELIKEIEKSKAKLEESVHVDKLILQNVNVGISVKDKNGKILLINDKWLDIFGKDKEFTIESTVGLTIKDVIDDKVLAEQMYQEDIAEKATDYNVDYELEVELCGQRTFLHVSKTQIVTDMGESSLITFVHDITMHKTVEEVLEKAKLEADLSARTKAEFLANMSHEIRTPLNAILGMTYLLEKTEMSDKQKEYLTKINYSGQHLQEIINNILDFSKIEAEMMQVENIEFSISNLIAKLSSLVSDKCAEKGLEFYIEANTDDTLFYYSDTLRITQILLNFLNNAIKFTEKGSIQLLIDVVDSSVGKHKLRFAIKDTGIGLSEEQRANLFTAFFQADSTITRKFGGTGLGLDISRKLANLLGGIVGVDSVLGEGSTFWFEVELNYRSKISQNIENINNLDGLLLDTNILVVDDSSSAVDLTREILSNYSNNIYEATSGESAIELVKAKKEEGIEFDLIFMDIRMSEMDGIETVKYLIDNDLIGRAEVVFVTGFGRLLVNTDGIENYDVIEKPLSQEVVSNTLCKIFDIKIFDLHDESESLAQQNETKDYLHQYLNGSEILLVEDNEINQEVAKEILEDEGIKIDIADNGQIAIDMVNKKHYDLVLMDMQMPVMDGLTATKKIRQNPKFKNLPILAMTANAMQHNVVDCLQAGMNDHISKPIDPKIVFSKIAKYLKSSGYEPPNGIVEEGLVIIDNENDNNNLTSNNEDDKQLDNASFVQSLRDIEELNVSKGLENCVNKESMYESIIKKFVNNNKDSKTEFFTAFEKGDLKTCERIAHTLKGVSATLGAITISEQAAEVEYSVNKDLEKQVISDKAQPLFENLENLMDKINSKIVVEKTEPKNQEVSTKEEQIEFLEELLLANNTKKPKVCSLILSRFDVVWEEEDVEEAELAISLTKKYKFKEAAEKIDSLLTKIKG